MIYIKACGITYLRPLTITHTEVEDIMTKSEKEAIKARKNDLVKQGIDKELAEVMARVELETGLIKTVVNY